MPKPHHGVYNSFTTKYVSALVPTVLFQLAWIKSVTCLSINFKLASYAIYPENCRTIGGSYRQFTGRFR